ncbi:hypothetical protein PBI_HYPERION_95 [Microbacterium phage Hyperion]|uniref:Uncharacterized protein n=1 Tax=Microbacterium phage Hyperion TaxID=2182354 RepID=A0A2U8UJ17_9CAUD|nr:hypothetical protein HOT27_gp095 [Microbacterium phage Hyperion]AWN03610.1 hypothetical protein PBI_HYPERION_95 [Microbacterium phage Hyperion]UJD20828.1 hypothetical protein SEA_ALUMINUMJESUS_93 [Microbacterium phage AluminumJesus]UVG34464.1 hypothetical protein SEA_GAZEBO_95 [Microbacterium phage Gazebo]
MSTVIVLALFATPIIGLLMLAFTILAGVGVLLVLAIAAALRGGVR